MPVMSGVDFAKIIRDDPTHDTFPIIYITAHYNNEKQIEECYNTGAVDFILKPINKMIVLGKTRSFLNLFIQKQEISNQNIKLLKLTNELETHEVKLEAQNEELLQAINKAEASSKKYTNLYDFAPTGYFTTDQKGTILNLNLSAAKLFGEDRSHLLKKDFRVFVTQESLPIVNDFLKRISTQGSKQNCEVTFAKTGDAVFHAILEGAISEDGQTCMISAFDITERKNAEEALLESENKYRQLVELANEGIWKINQESVTTFVNARMAEIMGNTIEEMMGRSLFSFMDDKGVALAQKNVERRKQGITEEHDFEFIRKDGKRIYTRLETSPINDEQGNYIGALALVSDITLKKQTEAALRESEKLYRTLLNASPEGIIIMDIEGQITEISNITLEIFGIENKLEYIGKKFLGFIPDEEQAKLMDILGRTQVEGLVQNVEFVLKRKNQTKFICEISTTLIQESDGSPKAYMAIIRDVTQRKKMETMHTHADRMASLGEMASGIAHEINQPLNTLSLVMDNIMYEATKKEGLGQEYLKKKSDKIFENITRIRNIIDHVRAFSRSHDDFVLAGFDINTSIRNAISLISEQFKHLAINLNIQLEKKLPAIFGNTFTFEQVILNLLSNARDALLERKTKESSFLGLSIGIRSFLEDKRVIIEITDNGIGISKEDIDHIMLPFYTTKDTGKGTGLGLSISYQIIKDMNGSIDVSLTELNETAFTIILPVPNQA